MHHALSDARFCQNVLWAFEESYQSLKHEWSAAEVFRIHIKVIDGIWRECEEEQRIGIQGILVPTDNSPIQ
jgi:hypothetical protein